MTEQENDASYPRVALFHGREFLCGGIAAFVNVTVVFPFHKTVFFQQLNGSSWLIAADKLKQEGWQNLYRGVLPPLLQRGAVGSLMFGVQSESERFLNVLNTSANLSYFTIKTISAGMAGCLEASLMPFERVQTLLQIADHSKSYKNTFHALSSLVRLHGVPELYRGLSPVLCRNCFGDILYFCGWDMLMTARSKYTLEETMGIHAWNFTVGGLLGAFIGVACFPLNVAKARMQSEVGGKFHSLSYTFYELIQERGKLLRLYRGVPANFIRSIVSWGIITMTYQRLMQL